MANAFFYLLDLVEFDFPKKIEVVSYVYSYSIFSISISGWQSLP